MTSIATRATMKPGSRITRTEALCLHCGVLIHRPSTREAWIHIPKVSRTGPERTYGSEPCGEGVGYE